MQGTSYSAKILMYLEFSRQIFEKYSYTICWEPSCPIRKDRQTDRQTDEQIVITYLTVAFRNFANVPELVL